jgi:tripartite-type tricarboxylate transporter receptor subunit TctC
VLPEVPTLREAGYPGFEEAGSDLWFGIVAPPKLRDALLDRLYTQTVAVVRSAEMQESIKLMGYEPWLMAPKEFEAFIRNDFVKWGKVVKMANLKQE